ncbi:hypothetical protein DPEC_G00350100 [Dallia pectoralis]|uniref:Uncharacterized protein n=1 Tax=Dallia pectoralis TaxID=75939 RepID=A0ACC2F1P5_DALPE|nr:hypothetical protein DPEC_G00350100 [Dallia pectoralis]
MALAGHCSHFLLANIIGSSPIHMQCNLVNCTQTHEISFRNFSYSTMIHNKSSFVSILWGKSQKVLSQSKTTRVSGPHQKKPHNYISPTILKVFLVKMLICKEVVETTYAYARPIEQIGFLLYQKHMQKALLVKGTLGLVDIRRNSGLHCVI